MSVATQFLFTSLLALGIALINTIALLRARHQARHQNKPAPDERSRWIMVVVLLLGSAGFLFQVPALYINFDQFVHVPNAAILASYISFLGCEACFHIWIDTWPGTTPHSTRSMMILLFAAASIALILLFTAGSHPDEHPLAFDTDYIRDPSTALFVSIYLIAFSIGWPWAAFRVHQARIKVRNSGQRWLIHALCLMEVGCVATTAYALILALVPLCVGLGLPEPRWAASVYSVLAAMSAVCSCAGFTTRNWGPRWDHFLDTAFPGHDERVWLQRLRPLYDLVHPAAPEEDQLPRGLGVDKVNPGAALAYLIVQIHEMSAFLADYITPEAAARAEKAGRDLTVVMMLTEAAAALEAGQPPVGAVALPEIPATPEAYGALAAALSALQLLPPATMDAALALMSPQVSPA